MIKQLRSLFWETLVCTKQNQSLLLLVFLLLRYFHLQGHFYFFFRLFQTHRYFAFLTPFAYIVEQALSLTQIGNKNVLKVNLTKFTVDFCNCWPWLDFYYLLSHRVWAVSVLDPFSWVRRVLSLCVFVPAVLWTIPCYFYRGTWVACGFFFSFLQRIFSTF